MSIALYPSSTARIFNQASPFTRTLAGGTTTAAGDCIISFLWLPSATATAVVSGAGATWTIVETADHNFATAVGYNCSAGQTTYTVTCPSATTINLSDSVWSGVATSSPVTATTTGATASGTSVSTGSVNYSARQLVIAGDGHDANSAIVMGTGVWSSGLTDTIIPSNGVIQQDYSIAVSSGTTTFSNTWSGAAKGGAAVVVLSPVSSSRGNMFLVL